MTTPLDSKVLDLLALAQDPEQLRRRLLLVLALQPPKALAPHMPLSPRNKGTR